jgi:hypothetical protein
MIWRALQCVLVLLLAGVGVAAPRIGPMLKLEPPSTGALTGALIGSAAAMLGALLTSLHASAGKKSSDAARRGAIKTLITAELVNVAAGYITLQRMLRAARRTTSAGSTPLDLSRDAPRSMPFTSALGTELLILSPQELDVLSTLDSNTTLTQRQIRDLSTREGFVGWVSITTLCQGVAHDMEILAQAFERFAPTRRLAIEGREPEAAVVLLRRLATELTGGNDHPTSL